MTRHGTGPPIRPDRVRQLERGFAFVPNRFLHEGFFASLNPPELALYFFLVLAGDRRGMSYYGPQRIASTLHLSGDAYTRARDGLIRRDLIAFDGRRFQVLSLPPKPLLPLDALSPRAGADEDDDDPAVIRRLIQASLAERNR